MEDRCCIHSHGWDSGQKWIQNAIPVGHTGSIDPWVLKDGYRRILRDFELFWVDLGRGSLPKGAPCRARLVLVAYTNAIWPLRTGLYYVIEGHAVHFAHPTYAIGVCAAKNWWVEVYLPLRFLSLAYPRDPPPPPPPRPPET